MKKQNKYRIKNPVCVVCGSQDIMSWVAGMPLCDKYACKCRAMELYGMSTIHARATEIEKDMIKKEVSLCLS